MSDSGESLYISISHKLYHLKSDIEISRRACGRQAKTRSRKEVEDG
jgi:hypothetical protein